MAAAVTKRRDDIIVCPSLSNSLMNINLKTGYFYDRSIYVQKKSTCSHSRFIKLDKELKLNLLDHSVKCILEPNQTHHHDPPPRQLVGLFFFRWQSVIYFVRDRLTPESAIELAYDGWMETLPISKQQAIEYFSKSVGASHKPELLSRCGPDYFNFALSFFKKTLIWSRKDHQILSVSSTENIIGKSLRVAHEKSDGVEPGEITAELYLIDCVSMDSSKLTDGYIVCASLGTGTVGIDPETGHFFETRKDRFGWCARRHLLQVDKDLKLWLMDHSLVCTAKKSEAHNHPPPPRPVVSMLLLRWKSIVHALWNPVSLTPEMSIGTVFDEWTEDLPVDRRQAVQHIENIVVFFKSSLMSEQCDPVMLKWVNTCGPEAFDIAVKFYAETLAFPAKENFVSVGALKTNESNISTLNNSPKAGNLLSSQSINSVQNMKTGPCVPQKSSISGIPVRGSKRKSDLGRSGTGSAQSGGLPSENLNDGIIKKGSANQKEIPSGSLSIGKSSSSLNTTGLKKETRLTSVDVNARKRLRTEVVIGKSRQDNPISSSVRLTTTADRNGFAKNPTLYFLKDTPEMRNNPVLGALSKRADQEPQPVPPRHRQPKRSLPVEQTTEKCNRSVTGFNNVIRLKDPPLASVDVKYRIPEKVKTNGHRFMVKIPVTASGDGSMFAAFAKRSSIDCSSSPVSLPNANEAVIATAILSKEGAKDRPTDSKSDNKCESNRIQKTPTRRRPVSSSSSSAASSSNDVTIPVIPSRFPSRPDIVAAPWPEGEARLIQRVLTAIETGDSVTSFDPKLVKVLTMVRNHYHLVSKTN